MYLFFCTSCAGIGHDDEVDIDKVPDPVPRGTFKPVVIRGSPSYIIFDLETTDLSKFDNFVLQHSII